jgi:hypothetical protein
MSVPTPAEIPAAEYRLFVRKGAPRFYLRNTDEGVYLSEKGIGWFIGGESYTRGWSEISGVNLIVAHIPKNGPIGTCRVVFTDGSVISILSASKWGQSDDERNVEYGRFLTDFHGAIPDRERGRIQFLTGFGQGQYISMTIVFVIAAAFFVVLPLGLTLYFREWEALFIAFAGAGLVAPLYFMARSGKPASYHPNQVPPDHYP